MGEGTGEGEGESWAGSTPSVEPDVGSSSYDPEIMHDLSWNEESDAHSAESPQYPSGISFFLICEAVYGIFECVLQSIQYLIQLWEVPEQEKEKKINKQKTSEAGPGYR